MGSTPSTIRSRSRPSACPERLRAIARSTCRHSCSVLRSDAKSNGLRSDSAPPHNAASNKSDDDPPPRAPRARRCLEYFRFLKKNSQATRAFHRGAAQLFNLNRQIHAELACDGEGVGMNESHGRLRSLSEPEYITWLRYVKNAGRRFVRPVPVGQSLGISFRK